VSEVLHWPQIGHEFVGVNYFNSARNVLIEPKETPHGLHEFLVFQILVRHRDSKVKNSEMVNFSCLSDIAIHIDFMVEVLTEFNHEALICSVLVTVKYFEQLFHLGKSIFFLILHH
jgi:hypothetical protein